MRDDLTQTVSPQLAVHFDRAGDDIHVRLDGELDLATADLLVNVVGGFDGVHDKLVVDLSELQFIDAAGLSALLTVQELTSARGASMVLARPGRLVRRLLAVTHLDRAFLVDSTGGGV